MRRPQLSVKMVLLQAEGGARERARVRVRDRRSAPLSRMSGTRCRRRWEVKKTLWTSIWTNNTYYMI